MPVYENGNEFTRLDYANSYNELLLLSRSKIDLISKYWELHALWRLKIHEEGLKQAKIYEAEFLESSLLNRYYNIVGELYKVQGNLKKSIEYLNKARVINEQVNNVGSMAATLNSLGEVLLLRGEYEKALELFFKSLTYYEKVGEAFTQISLENIAKVYLEQGKNQESYNYSIKSYNISVESDTAQEFQAIHLSNLVNVCLSINRKEEAKEYVDRLEKLETGNNSEVIRIHRDISEALILKASKRIFGKVKAQAILEEIVNKNLETLNDYQVQITIIPQLLELLIKEYHAYKEPLVFEEIEKYLEKFQNIAESQNLYPYLLKAYLLHAKFEFVTGETKKIEEYLELAKKLVKERELYAFESEIKATERTIGEALQEYKTMIQTNKELTDRMEKVDFENYIKQVSQSIMLRDK